MAFRMGRGQPGIRPASDGQANEEPASLTGMAAHANLAPMGLHELPDDVEAQTRPELPLGRAGPGEGVEDRRELRLGYPDPLVRDLQLREAHGARKSDVNGLSLAVLDGVREQVS